MATKAVLVMGMMIAAGLVPVLGPGTAAAETGMAWAYEQVAGRSLEPAGCRREVVLNGLSVTPAGPAAAWAETSACSSGPPVYRWGRQGAGSWDTWAIQDNLGQRGNRGYPAAFGVDGGGRPWYHLEMPGPWEWQYGYLLDLAADPTGGVRHLKHGIHHYRSCSEDIRFALTFPPGAAEPRYAYGKRCDSSHSGWAAYMGRNLPLGGAYRALGLATGPDGRDHLVYDARRYDLYGSPDLWQEVGGLMYNDQGLASERLLTRPANRHGDVLVAEVSMAVGGDGRIHVAVGNIPCCGNLWWGGLLYLTSTDGVAWERTFVDVVGGRQPSLALGPDGQPHISYRHWDGQLRLAQKDAGGWCSARIEGAGFDGYSYRSNLAFDGQQRARVLFVDPAGVQLATGTGDPCAGTDAPVRAPPAQTHAEGQDVRVDLVALTGAQPGSIRSVDRLPTGLRFDPATGLVTGTPGFRTQGTHFVTIEVATADAPGGKVCLEMVWRIVDNERPVAVVSVDRERANIGDTFTFDGSRSHDPDGTIGSFAWSRDGVPLGDQPRLPLAFPDWGWKCVDLAVRDAWGVSGAAAARKCVYVNRPPEAVASHAPPLQNLGRQVAFDGSASVDHDGRVAAHRWSFGEEAAEGPVARRAFTATGPACGELTVTDDDGATGKARSCAAITDRLGVRVAMARGGGFRLLQAAEGEVEVRYVTDEPAADVPVRVEVAWHSGHAALDDLAARAGCRTWTADGVTDGGGKVAFAVPRALLERCPTLPAAMPGLADLPTDLLDGGRYEVRASARDGHGNHGAAQGTYGHATCLAAEDLPAAPAPGLPAEAPSLPEAPATPAGLPAAPPVCPLAAARGVAPPEAPAPPGLPLP